MWCEKFNSFVYPACLSHQQGVTQALFDDIYVIFPMHVNFPITSRFVLKATIHENKSSKLFYVTCESLFSKRRFYDIVHACYIWLIFLFFHNLFLFFMFLYLSFINFFHHISWRSIHATLYTWLLFLRDFPFSSFPLIF